MSGTLQASVVKDSASATNNLALDASGNVTVGNNLTVTGATALSGALTAPAFIPSGSTVPTNGMYLSAANTLNLSTNTTNQVQISSAGIVTGTAGNLMLVQGTSQATTSGTSITFTGIPSWAKRITVMITNLTCNTASTTFILQIGSGSVTTTGYSSQAWTPQTNVVTTGFAIGNSSATATNALSGISTLSLIGSNTWVESGSKAYTNVLATGFVSGGYSPALSGALDRVVLTTVAGTATFSTGTINIQYE